MHHLEDKIRLVQQAKDEMGQVNSQQTSTISELQSKTSSLSMEIDNQRRTIEALQQVRTK